MNTAILNIKRGVLALALLMPAWAVAQLSIPGAVLSNGGTTTSNAQWIIKSTVAQPLIGITTSSNNQQRIGFWYQPTPLITSIESVGGKALAQGAVLQQNFPNPARAQTVIRFAVPRESFVSLILLNSNGKVIRRLAHKRLLGGQYQAEVALSTLPAGIYLYQLFVDQQLVASRKMVVGK